MEGVRPHDGYDTRVSLGHMAHSPGRSPEAAGGGGLISWFVGGSETLTDVDRVCSSQILLSAIQLRLKSTG